MRGVPRERRAGAARERRNACPAPAIIRRAGEENLMPKSDDEKAQEIQKKRDMARKGLAEHPDDGRDPLEKQDDREEKVEDAGLALGVGMKRS